MEIQSTGTNTSMVSQSPAFRETDASIATTQGTKTAEISISSFSLSISSNNTKETLSTVAINIRLADRTMDYINSDIISEMKKTLSTIVKQYPPYPPGSEERARYLKEFTGLRKQIEQLTIPPEYQFARKILSDPAQMPGTGDQTVGLGEAGRKITIRNQNVTPGPSGLNIPALSVESSDTEIAVAYNAVVSAETKINTKRSELGSDAAALAKSIEYSALPTDITEHDAIWQSEGVKQNLIQQGTPLINNNSLASFI